MNGFVHKMVFLLLLNGFNPYGCERNCENDYYQNQDVKLLTLNDTIELNYGSFYYNCNSDIGIIFEALLCDGRCPVGLACLWQGNAEVNFNLDIAGKHHSVFNLNTFQQFQTDTETDTIISKTIDYDNWRIIWK